MTDISWHALSDASLRFSFCDCLTRIQAGQVLFFVNSRDVCALPDQLSEASPHREGPPPFIR